MIGRCWRLARSASISPPRPGRAGLRKAIAVVAEATGRDRCFRDRGYQPPAQSPTAVVFWRQQSKNLAGEEGFEPSDGGIRIRCLNQLGDSPSVLRSTPLGDRIPDSPSCVWVGTERLPGILRPCRASVKKRPPRAGALRHVARLMPSLTAAIAVTLANAGLAFTRPSAAARNHVAVCFP